jgi:hypothetical protein
VSAGTKELTLHNIDFRIGRLNVFDQADVSRVIAPFIPSLIPMFKAFGSASESDAKMAELISASQPFLDAMARMSRDDSRFVISTCLSVVRRRQGEAWSIVYNRDAGTMMFDDLDLSSVLPLVVRVVRDNLGPFISGILTGQAAPEVSPKAPR